MWTKPRTSRVNDVAIDVYNRIVIDGEVSLWPITWLLKNLCHSMIVANKGGYGSSAGFAKSLMFNETPEHYAEHYAFHQSFYEVADMLAKDDEEA